MIRSANINGATMSYNTGKIYEENEVKNIGECGICITDEQAKDEKWIKEHHAKDLAECVNCRGCPLYNYS